MDVFSTGYGGGLQAPPGMKLSVVLVKDKLPTFVKKIICRNNIVKCKYLLYGILRVNIVHINLIIYSSVS